MEEDKRVMIGRCEEQRWMESRLTAFIQKEHSCSVYVSGQPGTGKTATIQHLLLKPCFHLHLHAVFLNCTSLRGYSDLCRRLLPVADRRRRLPTVAALSAAVHRRFTHSDRPTVLVLDEIDQLSSVDVLYRVFSWTALPGIRLMLIGIANSLDLTDRLLPKLHLSSTPPCLLHFPPYTKDQVMAIVQHRLSQTSTQMSKAAMELCARKAAAVTGDIRQALDLVQIAVDKQRRTATTTSTDGGCSDVIEALNGVYGSALRATVQLPVQQKVLLATVIGLSRHRTGKESKLPELVREYARVCRAQGLLPVDETELMALCQLLESSGLLCIQKQSSTRRVGVKIQLLVDENSVKTALNDDAMLNSVLRIVSSKHILTPADVN